MLNIFQAWCFFFSLIFSYFIIKMNRIPQYRINSTYVSCFVLEFLQMWRLSLFLFFSAFILLDSTSFADIMFIEQFFSSAVSPKFLQELFFRNIIFSNLCNSYLLLFLNCYIFFYAFLVKWVMAFKNIYVYTCVYIKIYM